MAQSGRRGSVTISTNMAGRGTDILLGGNPEYMAKVSMRRLSKSDEATSQPAMLTVGRECTLVLIRCFYVRGPQCVWRSGDQIREMPCESRDAKPLQALQWLLRPVLCVAQLKLREALLPEVVSQVEALEGHASSNGSRPQASANGKKGKGKGAKKGGPLLKTWAANPKLFPCDVSPEAPKLIDEVRHTPFWELPRIVWRLPNTSWSHATCRGRQGLTAEVDVPLPVMQ